MLKKDSRWFKTRISVPHNYRAVYFHGKTIRQALDPSKPILELKYPEFYDVCITSACKGNCSYCYQDSGKEQKGYKDPFKKIKEFFGPLTKNQKPFQIAYGGGNPNEHKDFHKIMKWSYENEITPNYTTNGMGITRKVIQTTKKYCGGVAVTCHEHLEKYWTEAVEKFSKAKIKINLHILISDDWSVEDFLDIFYTYKSKVEYFVLLPMMATGRCSPGKAMNEDTFNYLNSCLKNINGIDQIAFGANFYPYLKNEFWLQLSIYEPEILSKYLDLKDMKIYKSSFSKEIV